MKGFGSRYIYLAKDCLKTTSISVARMLVKLVGLPLWLLILLPQVPCHQLYHILIYHIPLAKFRVCNVHVKMSFCCINYIGIIFLH